MQIDVTFVPASLPAPEGRVCIVIDALRATSTLVTLLAQGVEEVLAVGSLAEARREAAKRPGWLLCGEKRSLPPKGFDYGNSPSEFSRLSLRGKSVVFVTTNGTRALLRASGCQPVFAGAILNVAAVATVARKAAVEGRKDVLVQCAGNEGGRAFNLEDAFCAGAIVDAMTRGVEQQSLNDEAQAARRIYASFDGSAAAAFRSAEHGEGLSGAGLAEDVTFCARRDLYATVPVATRTGDGVIVCPTRA